MPAHPIANDKVASVGSRRNWDESIDDDAAFEPLSRDQAKALRKQMTFVSPWRVVAAQGLTGLLCAALFWLFSRNPGMPWSALYGAAAVVLPGVLLARGLTRGAGSPLASAAAFMFWEMLKIGPFG